MANVVYIAFIGVSLPFETDVVVSRFHLESILHQPNQKLKRIPQIEEHVSHFPLLAGVNELMVQFARFQFAPSPLHKDGAEEVEPVVGTKGDETIVDDFHGDKVSDFSFETHAEDG